MKFMPGAAFGSMSGKLGGVVASHNSSGAYLRNHTIPVNPNTPAQANTRAIFSNLSNRWKTTVTASQAEGWSNWAKNSPFTDVLGSSITMSSNNAYLKINSIRMLLELAPIDEAPTIFGEALAIVPDSSAISISEATQSLIITAASDLVGWDSTLVNDYCLFFLSGPQSPRTNFFKGPFKASGNLLGGAVPPTFPASITVPVPVFQDQKVFVRTVHLSPDNCISSEIILPYIVGT